ncbi:MAG: hypothetical protein PHH58_05275 [Rhodoferax sp.]|nr:hypothetical protein [Rhodoferax sp.]
MFKIAIGNVVVIPVKFTMKDGSVSKQFAFTLIALRKTEDDLDLKPEQTIKECLLESVTDWVDQRFVLLENNEPAPFGPVAFEYMLKQPGVLDVVWEAYRATCRAKEKN